MRVPKFKMGEIAAQMLIRHVESKAGVPPQKVFLDAELVVRGSTRAPAAAALPALRQSARPDEKHDGKQDGKRDGRRSSPRDARATARR